jgi:hypothetical protein
MHSAVGESVDCAAFDFWFLPVLPFRRSPVLLLIF